MISKIRKKIFLLIFFLNFVFSPLFQYTYAAGEGGQSLCTSLPGVSITITPQTIPENIKEINIDIDGLSDGKYRLRIATPLGGIVPIPNIHQFIPDNGLDVTNGKASFIINSNDRKLTYGKHSATLEKFYSGRPSKSDGWDDYCQNVEYIIGFSNKTCQMVLSPTDPTDTEQIRIDVFYASKAEYLLLLNNRNIDRIQVGDDGRGTKTIGPLAPLSNSTLSLDQLASQLDTSFCKATLNVRPTPGGTSPRPVPSTAPSPPPLPLPTTITDVCNPNGSSYDAKKCTSSGDKDKILCGDPNNPGIQTAIGCIHTEPATFIRDFLNFTVGISGGLAFLLMLLGAFQMLTSAGNPETLQAGRERFQSAIIGLLFVIFAVLLLQIIGFDILKIPGFGR